MAFVQIDFEAYRHNLELLSEKAGGLDKLMVVLKDNAYGHGIQELAPLAAAIAVRYAAVKDRREAKLVEAFFEKVLILVDFPQENDEQHSNWVFVIHSIESLKNINPKVRIHVSVDTGMRRNGINLDELETACKVIQERDLRIEGVLTHFMSADELDSSYFVQKTRFEKVKEYFKENAQKYGFKVPFFHSCNSAGLLRHQGEFSEDFARVGIASYGYTDLPASFGEFDLKPIMSLWAEKISSRDIQKGDRVGYGGVFEANKPMRISAYDLGYGDGLTRYNGKGSLHVKDGRPFLGKISMDSFILEGEDEVVCVFDDAMEFAEYFDTIRYEIITRVSPFLKKKVVK